MITLVEDQRSIYQSVDKVEVPTKEEERAAVIPQVEVVQDLITIHMEHTNKEITIIISTTIKEDLIGTRKHHLAIMLQVRASLPSLALRISYLLNTSVIQI